MKWGFLVLFVLVGYVVAETIIKHPVVQIETTGGEDSDCDPRSSLCGKGGVKLTEVDMVITHAGPECLKYVGEKVEFNGQSFPCGGEYGWGTLRQDTFTYQGHFLLFFPYTGKTDWFGVQMESVTVPINPAWKYNSDIFWAKLKETVKWCKNPTICE